MEQANFFIVFVEGLLSIFSSCILPILPVYLSMLSNSSGDNMEKEDFRSGTLIRNTIFFVLGISTTFFILGSSISALGTFFTQYRNMIMIIGGFIIILMGLFYLGIIKSDLLNREKRFNAPSGAMSWWTAFLLGLSFSFGWTPCIGPVLSSVVIMASTAESMLISNLLILVYIIGFISPFIIASLFYSKLYKKFDLLKGYMVQIKKISGIFIIMAGCVMLVTAFTNINRNPSNEQQIDNSYKKEESNSSELQVEETKNLAPDFMLYDQDGKKHKLSDYKGKTVFLNIWATWCPPCRRELPAIDAMYKEYNSNKDDVVVLGITAPKVGREGSEEEIINFLSHEGYTFPVVFDYKGIVLDQYRINSFPSTFIIDKEGNISQHIPGAMDKATMKKAIESAK